MIWVYVRGALAEPSLTERNRAVDLPEYNLYSSVSSPDMQSYIVIYNGYELL